MPKSKRSLLISAALTGLVAGSMPALTADALAQPNGGAMSTSGESTLDPSGGAGRVSRHKHRKFKNSCKGKDGNKNKGKGKHKHK